MTTLFAPSFFPQVGTKLFWIKANRVLAWSLIVSPPIQFCIGMSFITGLWIDLAILVAHGALSLALFGKPETRERTWKVTMHLLGFRSADMSERNRFLLSGYRIVLGAVAAGMIFWKSGYLGAAVIVLCLRCCACRFRFASTFTSPWAPPCAAGASTAAPRAWRH